MSLDLAIVTALNRIVLASDVLPSLTVFFGEYLPYMVVAALLFPAMAKVTRRERIWFAAETLLSALIARLAFVELIRLFIERLRPFAVDGAVVALIEESSFSFPSGHASFFFALATGVFLHNRRWGTVFFAASTVISVARIAAGVHYPTDILGGALLGCLVAWVAHKLFAKKTLPQSLHL